MRNNHSTTHPTTGQVATRSSENRVYSHAVWTRLTPACLAKSLEWQLKHAKSSAEYWQSLCEDNGADYVQSGAPYGKTNGEMVELTKQQLAEVEKKIAEFVPEHGPWEVEGWCGTAKLAQSRASSLRSKLVDKTKHLMYEVLVTEATVVTKAEQKAAKQAEKPKKAFLSTPHSAGQWGEAKPMS